MKALSLWQPWASFVAYELKPHETRHWYTSYRGPLAIHAAKTTKGVLELGGDCEGCIEDGWRYGYIGPNFEIQVGARGSEMILSGHLPAGMDPAQDLQIDLPMGAIICTADLVSCLRMPLAKPREEWDEALGNWEAGRYAWHLENVRRLAVPIPYRGAQGLFDVPDWVFNKEAAR